MRSALNRTPLHRYSPFYPAILLRTGYQNPPARSPDRPRYTVQRPRRICFPSLHPEKCRSARRHPAQGLPVPPPTAGNPPSADAGLPQTRRYSSVPQRHSRCHFPAPQSPRQRRGIRRPLRLRPCASAGQCRQTCSPPAAAPPA